MGSNAIRKFTRASQVFPAVFLPPNQVASVNSKSYKHFIECGIMRPVSAGLYAWLPIGYRVVEKLKNIVESEMTKINAQKLKLPSLIKSDLWKQTNRFEEAKNELFLLKDRHEAEYILSPTYEEQICYTLSSIGILSAKYLPLRLYQFGSKWRDERRPRNAFFRSREFLMKDLYTFDATFKDAQNTYKLVCETYDSIFKKVGIDFYKVIGDTGIIGGKLSHEYHYSSDFGDDTILSCSSCHYQINETISQSSQCPKCNVKLSACNTTEVGHTFLLGTKYSDPMKVLVNKQNKTVPVVMGCYGLGIDRMIMAAVEILSTKDELRWPKSIAPYTVCVIPPKSGSKEEKALDYVDSVTDILDNLNIDTILDDRTDLTVGRRLLHARKAGYPYVIIIGKAAIKENPALEFHDVYAEQQFDIPIESLTDCLKDIKYKTDSDVVSRVSKSKQLEEPVSSRI